MNHLEGNLILQSMSRLKYCVQTNDHIKKFYKMLQAKVSEGTFIVSRRKGNLYFQYLRVSEAGIN